jgi:predicted nucleotidyltransferase
VKPDIEKGRRFLDTSEAPNRLLVGVTGAHYYGFPSPDSDLDLKGIHVAPTARIVSLAPPADAVDFLGIFEGLEIDYTSHEIAAAVTLPLRGNGSILERILSPFQLIESREQKELARLAHDSASKKFVHHYRGFFGRMKADWQKANEKTVKGLLYAYRSALTGIHLLRTGECLGDVTTLAPIYGFDRVPKLVQLKGQGTEHGAIKDTGEFQDDLTRLDELLEQAHAESSLPDQAQNQDAIDRFLVALRHTYFD